ncbi:uncharacterized protein LOC121863572 [Homarus americanus]|uniref:uncharacterized protein LOC121863572 n=1 Tax=Homarus americanus TaxID=6706 RepID=UPI001C44B6BA|nr:uncharacterized protein LOC121863572 [Homarus americanus]
MSVVLLQVPKRNTSLQRNNHELSLQVHDLRARLGLPLASTPPEKLGKVGGVMVGCLSSPSLDVSPTFGVSTRTSIDSVLGLPVPLDTKHEDVLSTCSSDGSSSGCLVPGPDLPGAAHLERLAHLADSLLIASRNISRTSGLIPYHGFEKITSATSLGDLTSGTTFGHMRSSLALSRATSSSVGNLTNLYPDRKDKATSPISKLNCRVSEFSTLVSPGSKVKSRMSEAILAAPVKERRSSFRLYNSDSIEEADEEEVTTARSGSRMSASQGSSSTLKDSSSPSQGSSRTSPASSTRVTHLLTGVSWRLIGLVHHLLKIKLLAGVI